jgi:hypothetical protein
MQHNTSRTFRRFRNDLLDYAGTFLGAAALDPDTAYLTSTSGTADLERTLVGREPGLEAARARTFLDALLQPSSSLATERIALPAAIADMYRRSLLQDAPFPRLVKAASYPSASRLDRSVAIGSENFWILDLFAAGRAYVTGVGDAEAFTVLNTAVYELWNLLEDKQAGALLRDLPAHDGGSRLLERFEDQVGSDLGTVLRATATFRQNYLCAAAHTCGIRPPVDVRRIMSSESYLGALSGALERAGETLLRRPRSAGFAAMVYAEEHAMRELGMSGYTGYVREEIRLARTVLGFSTGQADRTPYVFYTRPTPRPDLVIGAPTGDFARVLAAPRLALYAREILLKLGRIDHAASHQDVVDSAVELSNEVADRYLAMPVRTD